MADTPTPMTDQNLKDTLEMVRSGTVNLGGKYAVHILEELIASRAALASRSPEGEWVRDGSLPMSGKSILFDVPTCYGVEIGIFCAGRFVSDRTGPYNETVSWPPENVSCWRETPSPPSTPSPEEPKR